MLKIIKICTKPINFSRNTIIYGSDNVFFFSKIWSCEFLFANLPTFIGSRTMFLRHMSCSAL